jgi:hypothetical protein
MAELKKKGEAPLSPKARHQRDTGSGSYNRFNLLAPPSPRPRLGSKRKLEPDPISGSKSPRLDPNVVFNQLRDVEDNLVVVKSTVAAVMSAGDGVFNIAEGGLGAAVHKLALAVDMLVSNQEKLLSAVVDAAGAGGNNRPTSFATVAKNGTGGVDRRTADDGRPTHDPVPPADSREKKIRQAITRAERSTVIYDADLGNVPVMNKDTLARKVTILLHDKARREGEYHENPKHAEEAVDDFLSCASLDFLGRGTKPFFNRKNLEDPRNKTFCTMPIKLTWKTKEERIRGEQAIRRVCKTRCSTPYPRKIRGLIDEVLKEGQSAKPGCFIRIRINIPTLSIIAHAREGDKWTDLNLRKPIPVDVLDPAEMVDLTPEDDMEDLS